MQPELAIPADAAPRPAAPARRVRFVLPGTIAATLAFELALAERKFAIFGGGFGQSQALDGLGEIAAFLSALLACQAVLFTGLWLLLKRLHGGTGPVFLLNFAAIAGVGWIGALVARYQALSYFSDALSFEIVRNLGGGSLSDALLYSLAEARLVGIAAAGAALAYGALLLRARRRPAAAAPAGPTWRTFAIGAAALPFLLFAANRIEDARAALVRFHAPIVAAAALHRATDFDRDGWSWFSHPLDRAPFDAARHPYALDVPGNGVDEDGYGGDLAFAAPAEAPPAAFAGRKRHVLLIVLESTRGDVLGKRVGGRAVAPTIEALARRGSIAPHAYSHVGFTTQSLQTLFTGKLAPEGPATSLIRDFAANGYRTAVFSGQSEAFGGIASVTAMDEADIFVDAETLKDERGFGFAAPGSLYVDGRKLLREFDRRLGAPALWERPNFLYFNFQSAHFPYFAPGMDRILEQDPIPRGEISLAARARVERTYWNAIAYNDRLIAALLDRLQTLGVLEDTLVVITADHGESLFDDGFLGHGHMLNRQQTHIPFVLGDPDIELPDPLGLADMRAVILRAAGAPVPALRAEPLFQYLGSLDRPGSIGTFDGAGRRRIFDLFRESFWSDGSGRWTPYSRLAAGSAEKAAADALIDEWARQRWLARLESERPDG